MYGVFEPMHKLAELLGLRGDNQAARELYQKVFDSASRTLGSDCPASVRSLEDLLAFFRRQNNLDEAKVLYKEVLVRMKVLRDFDLSKGRPLDYHS